MSQDAFRSQDLFSWPGSAAYVPGPPACESRPPLCDPAADDPAWIEHELVVLEARIEKGRMLVEQQRDSEGTDNLRYLRYLQRLLAERQELLDQLEQIRSQEPLSFVAARRRRAEAAFQELVAMNLRREYDSPRYLEQELLVRRYLREDPELADRLLAGS